MKKKYYYWEIHLDTGKIEYWRSEKSTYNFKTMFKPEAKCHVVEARPISHLVYWYKRNKYQKSFECTLL